MEDRRHKEDVEIFFVDAGCYEDTIRLQDYGVDDFVEYLIKETAVSEQG